MSESDWSAPQTPWTAFGQRYANNYREQWLIVVEQFAEIAELLRTGGVAKIRIALILVDHLAEVVLVRHRDAIESATDRSWITNAPRLDTRQRQRFSADFGFRVSLAGKPIEAGLTEGLLGPILDSLDDAIFRAAHAFRNRTYHADSHNPAVLPFITRLYVGAVGRAFVRQQPRSMIFSVFKDFERRLDAIGFDSERRIAVSRGSDVIASEKTTRAVLDFLFGDLTPELAELREQLGRDLSLRVLAMREMLSFLEQDGFHPEPMRMALTYYEMVRTTVGDDKLIELDRQRANLFAVWRETRDDEDMARAMQLGETRKRRLAELEAAFSPMFGTKELDSIERGAQRLANARDPGILLTRYRALDQRAEAAERVVDDTAVGWDEYVEHQNALRRGK